jgi:hypothetical protein
MITKCKVVLVFTFLSMSLVVQAQTMTNVPHVISLPDFLHNEIKETDDTTWSYEYYDKYAHKVGLFDLKSVDDLDNVKFYKVYKSPSNDSRTGFSPYVCELVYTYVAIDTNMWLRAIPESKEAVRYEMFGDKLVYTDSVSVIDPRTKKERSVILQYFKTGIVENKE